MARGADGSVETGWDRLDARAVIVSAATLLTMARAIRGWAIYPSWFFLDDYNLLHDARDRPLGPAYLFEAYNGHFMPAGRLVAWVVQTSGPVNWTLAATVTLVLQLLASAAAWWMLTTLFGMRWSVLAPFALYLYSALTFPAVMWWAAALNLVPVQASLFASTAAWVLHLRTGRRRWLWCMVGCLVFGLAFDVKAALIIPVLLYVGLAYFESGPLSAARPLRAESVGLDRGAVRPVIAYATYYLTSVPLVAGRSDGGEIADIAGTMLGTSSPATVLGGPWRWTNPSPPTAYVDTPAWAVNVSWIIIIAVVASPCLRFKRAGRAWVLLTAYLVALLGLLVTSRGDTFGSLIGLELRYLTDAACVTTLCLGLAFLPVIGSVESSEPREPALLTRAAPRATVRVLTALVVVGGVISSTQYARYWHHDNASQSYLHNLAQDLRAYGRVDLADQPAPDAVLSHLTAPLNTTRRLAELLTEEVSFPSSSPNLVVVADDGGLRRAQIDLGVTSLPGPTPNCGWRVTEDGLTVPLAGRAFEWTWWMRVGYLASADSPVTVTAGRTTVETSVRAGLNSLYVKAEGSFTSVRFDGLDPGTTLCVDTVEVGQPIPGATLS